ncbi:hypothetical protein Pcinc_002368 [Petrolisthes cinctipes]|uniref:Uncharacterized protein n=1 Tax=Petrolisthes cinctipes TaxID=88211 RepID=A0AAE1GJW8_PETCI|nr:hypothetical protein Pcinc_002368 [Petrolisthes cinctipes]
MSQVITLTSCDSGSGCDHVQIFKTFAGHLCDYRIARLVAAWTQYERSSVAARCNVATTACVKVLRSRATLPPSDVAATHRPPRCVLAQSPLGSDRVTTSQRPPINLHQHHHEERSEEHLWQAPEEGEEEVCGPSVCGSDH